MLLMLLFVFCSVPGFTQFVKNIDEHYQLFREADTRLEKLHVLEMTGLGSFIHENSDEIVDFVLECEKQNDLDSKEACSLELALGKYHQSRQAYGLAVEKYNLFLECRINMTSEDSAKIYFYLVNCFIEMGSLEGALFYKERIEEIRSRTPELHEYSGIQLDKIYYKIGHPSLAASVLSARFYEGDRDRGTCNNLGVYYLDAEMPDSALKFFYLAIQTLKDEMDYNPDAWALGLYTGNVGQAQMSIGQYSEAIPNLRFDVERSLASKRPKNAFISLCELAKCYVKTNNIIMTRSSIDDAEELFNVNYPLKSKIKFYEAKSEVFEFEGQFDSALFYQKRSQIMLDSIEQIHIKNRSLGAVLTFDIRRKNEVILNQKQELKNEKIQTENAELRIIQEEQKNQRYFIFSIALIVLILVILIFFKKISQRQKELLAKNEIIAEQKIKIEKSLGQKSVLLNEVHHRVKNNLQVISSMLQLQSDQFTEDRFKDAILESKERIRSIALIHQKLYQDDHLGMVEMNDYIHEISMTIRSLFGDRSYNILNDSKDIQLSIDTAVPLGLIINELLTNSFKYAYDEKRDRKIWVQLAIVGDQKLRLVVRDEGKGLTDEINLESPRTLGLKLVQLLSEQLNGEMHYEYDSGAIFTVEFKTT